MEENHSLGRKGPGNPQNVRKYGCGRICVARLWHCPSGISTRHVCRTASREFEPKKASRCESLDHNTILHDAWYDSAIHRSLEDILHCLDRPMTLLVLLSCDFQVPPIEASETHLDQPPLFGHLVTRSLLHILLQGLLRLSDCHRFLGCQGDFLGSHFFRKSF